MLTPSVAVAVLEVDFPFSAQPSAGGKVHGNLQGQVAALISVLDRIPDDLLVLDGTDQARLFGAIGQLRSAVETWQHRGEPVGAVDFALFRTIRDVLKKCPDRRGTSRSADFEFLKDVDLAADLAADMNEINLAIANGEWKSATVLGGSVIEALLLWDLQQHEQTARAAAARLYEEKELAERPSSSLLG